MLDSRRHLLQSFAAFIGLLATSPFLLAHQARPQPVPSPNAPSNPNAPQGLEGRGASTPVDQKSIDRQNQAAIRSDVDKMFSLVSELKQELAATNTTSTLSVTFVKKAHEIEKLAKHVKDLAKG
jgi:hypothetical protein